MAKWQKTLVLLQASRRSANADGIQVQQISKAAEFKVRVETHAADGCINGCIFFVATVAIRRV